MIRYQAMGSHDPPSAGPLNMKGFMMSRQKLPRSFIAVICICLMSISSFSADRIGIVSFQSHGIYLTLDVETQRASIKDEGTMLIGQGDNSFRVAKSASIESFSIDSEATEFAIDSVDEQLWISFHSEKEGSVEFAIEFIAEFADEVENARFSRERVGGEVNGTILDQGAYLSSDAYFYPQGSEGLARFSLTADIPSDWESISDGNLLSATEEGDRKIQNWANPFLSDGCMFMAAPYIIKSTRVDNLEVACYFFPEDTALIDGYLTATASYIKMYSELIGPYPYERFTVAENFFPTGYGMPAWTLLGQQVIRLPFIKSTSLGHEVLHNWWGNSVYVDYDRGNWCESATVYGADYRYKLMQSPDVAKDYRKNILKQYVSYINDGNDFPIREFKSRTSPGTRTIGYNKAMMVFHMIEEIIGSDSFFAAWKTVFEKYVEKQISWEEWISTFEAESGSDLSYVIPQWIDRAGAPILGLEVIGASPDRDADNNTVVFKLTQTSGSDYRLMIPIRLVGTNTVFDTTVILDSEEAQYTITPSDRMTVLEIDPDVHLFRRLYSEEIEPIVSAVLGHPTKKFVSFTSDTAYCRQFELFAENIMEDSVVLYTPDLLDKPERDYLPVLLNPEELPSYLDGRIKIVGDSVVVNNVSYPRNGHTFVLSGGSFEGFEKHLVVLSSDPGSLARIGQLTPHYGKYSFLVFEGSRNVGKGQWTIDASPLRVDLRN